MAQTRRVVKVRKSRLFRRKTRTQSRGHQVVVEAYAQSGACLRRRPCRKGVSRWIVVSASLSGRTSNLACRCDNGTSVAISDRLTFGDLGIRANTLVVLPNVGR
jgi:hypothetical protein